MDKYISYSEEDTRRAAAALAARLKRGDVVALLGDLGAGKTAFVKGVAEFFNAEGDVSSPTFTIVNEYIGDINIYHFDAYRLERVGAWECDWLDDYLFGDGICLIEWAENIESVLPNETIYVRIEKYPEKGDDYREIAIC